MDSTSVLLLSMPFGPLYQPSIGLSSLKGTLKPLQISCKILYLAIPFARYIGSTMYNRVAGGQPYVDLAGEWLFSKALFGDDHPKAAEFVDNVLRRKDARNMRRTPVNEKYIEELQRVGGFIDRFMDEMLELIVSHQPRIVGFTSTFQQHVASLAMAKRVKERLPDVKIIFGGANCEGLMGVETVRQFPFVDYVVSGEGEIIFPDLIQGLLQGKSVSHLQGVFTRDNIDLAINGIYLNTPSVRDMDALPIPDYDDYFEQVTSVHLDQETRILFETSRGCWWGEKHHCTFCGLNGQTMFYRSKSAKRALDELLYLTSRYPKNPVWVVDNILDMKYLKSFVPELKKLSLDLQLFYEVKSNLTKEQIRLMRDAGITKLQPGIESLSDHVLDLMKKGVSGLQNIQLLKWCRELGVDAYWNVLWGFPGETEADYAEMADLIPLLSHFDPPVGSATIRLDRFSPNYDRAGEFGFKNVKPALPYEYIYPFDESVNGNLAYHFFYEYEDQRDVFEYTRPVLRKLSEWRKSHHTSALFSVNKGDTLLIWDLRPAAKQLLSVLSGDLKKLYDACDQTRSVRQLQDVVSGDVETMLAPLVERGLLLKQRSVYLSLTVPLGTYAPQPVILERLCNGLADLNVQLDNTKTIEHNDELKLTDAYFDVDENGQVVVYEKAIRDLIDAYNDRHAERELVHTLGGITIDM